MSRQATHVGAPITLNNVSHHADESQAGGLSRCSTPDILAEVWLHEGEVGGTGASQCILASLTDTRTSAPHLHVMIHFCTIS